MNKPEKLEVWDEAKLVLMFGGDCLVNTEDEHYKFWAIERIEDGYQTHWGRIGKAVQSQVIKSYSYSIDREIQTKIRGKIRKGYRKLGE